MFSIMYYFFSTHLHCNIIIFTAGTKNTDTSLEGSFQRLHSVFSS